MLAEYSIVMDPHNVVLVVLVLRFEIAKQAQFDTCLMLETLLITDDFDGDHCLFHVIEAFERLAKATRAKFVQNFKSVGQMIFHDDLIVTTLIIKAKIVPEQRSCLDFWSV